MENDRTLSLKNRRVLVVIFFITLMTPFTTIYLLAEKLEMTFLWLIPLGLLILNGSIAYFIKSRSDVFFQNAPSCLLTKETDQIKELKKYMGVPSEVEELENFLFSSDEEATISLQSRINY